MVSPGILLVDKPAGLTSHDVVARTRRAFGTRKVGHAGTLDPMATGLLVIGIEGATRLLTYIVGADKTYAATIRLGQTTSTDDAEGGILTTAAPEAWESVSDEAVSAGIARLTGEISQVPSAVSAIKVDGRRAYERVRAGEEVVLAARDVVVSRFDLLGRREGDGYIDLDVVVDCSSGTYIRSLARDLGSALGVGGHLTALRRTRVGPFDVTDAVGIEALEGAPTLTPGEAAGRLLPVLAMSVDDARDLRHGKRLAGQAVRLESRLGAAIDEDGVLIGIVERRGADLKSAMNMPEGDR
ncbi:MULTISPECIES: tRNA pseudouridine(55) synthase TruB [unclassified Microbacterium]|uniref:tRNA pseudouridine(55) synthase TruB n=1 Tax=unclassified Microbacterium TaxID=2609290 RepID=UPI00049308D3|nr:MULTISPECIES: tRNA pseudouridine(55) synthase TruB [unclassified Microbacterium]MCV0333360.1 tRNA pseudouridine(55) synthase TruB [Microbacterium sp.]MCV0375805.1 tRNA pseudouridine(55) synthase TruB [Microbacterium sp.]MCV0388840.1 tRNA pseudouridine(55) synthase TruB [Microbacterium sp.]MCV0417368.1 tRNA pseudouridine(55) synthase TruB [Microbacterium sp.]MCV0420679.1 tRNA pseudouridine(55) synthase TruB [Microbacterium sp.]